MTLLQEEFLPEVRRDRQPPFRLEQDHSPVHMARRVCAMLEAEDDVELVPWMPRGVDDNKWGGMANILTPVLRAAGSLRMSCGRPCRTPGRS